ncbi:Methyltransferase-like protein 24-like 9 [Homarus americanus]|uniref:Methyltransferase-like protein 24-like 9 n=1 Tax=Homarus americanus TaxID=6706 RepID=A0A8J5NE72_HOMAM|nr:Methyltransferase-like protein 24-like 9 [Homarus americanus]
MLPLRLGRKFWDRFCRYVLVSVCVVYVLYSPAKPAPKRLPELRETLGKGVFEYYVEVDHLTSGSQVMVVYLVKGSPTILRPLHYVHRAQPPSPLILGSSGRGRVMAEEGTLVRVEDYFTHLYTPQADCKKLLILDSTFDEAMSDLNCEVHMFDLLPAAPAHLLNKSQHAYFHQVGLADSRRQHYFLNLEKEIPMDTLTGIMINNSLTDRFIHILKVDIEDNEWEVLEQLIKDPILDIVGQLALEVHAENAPLLSPQDLLVFIRRRYDLLKAIEGRGFRIVAYWNNKKSRTFKDDSGATHRTCGEILYINSNWSNTTFMAALM